MLGFLGRRLLYSLPVLIGISMLVFMVIHLIPGDPVRMMVGDSPVSAEVMERMREQLGFNRPLLVQYFDYLGKVLRGDLGQSIHTHETVAREIAMAFPNTLELTLGSLAFAVVVGIPLGIMAATKANSVYDTCTMVFAMIGVSMPTFWSGLLLIYAFAFKFSLFPTVGAGGLKALVLPSISLGLYAVATIARIVRSSMLEVLNEDYVRVARAKGLAERVVVYKHALRNALIPTTTIIGLQIGLFLSGAVITETVFTRPGIGKLLVDAILWRDYPVVQGVLLVTASCYILINILVDVSYGILDPRVRLR